MERCALRKVGIASSLRGFADENCKQRDTASLRDDASKLRLSSLEPVLHCVQPILCNSCEKECKRRDRVSVITTVSANTAPVSPFRHFGSNKSMLKANTIPVLNSPPIVDNAA